MTNKEFIEQALNIAQNYHTVYLWGTFGAPLTEGLIAQKAKQYPKNYSSGRQTYLRSLISKRPWAFDCNGLIKGILWGWTGDGEKSFGGAVYQANDVPDIGAGTLARASLEQSTDMNHILPGEVVYKSGHIGIYAGDGKVIEATLRDSYDGVVITDLTESGWTGHGKLPWINYTRTDLSPTEPETPPSEGDTVMFSGGKHYTSANGDTGYTARPGPATVTRYLEGRKHPYHIIHTDGTSNVYGWVDEDTVRKA